ncbi:hypothetical protein GCM10007925_07950 [Sphingomonas astaxanthinifaciens DSM 22298]|uniref:Peptidase S1 domain-containing protein n=1 Tax=Sphingomonas astaxanthinifaciens DSM 22298 TaxID=1123267 RepID=A0ABQ5Z2T8_9SPHN|nr:hypothetical protein GCM10007925_07950 [Sphingomonas astaxanthinifaciens DSM 22298]
MRIDPGVGEEAAEILSLLGNFPFVTVGEPADYLVTTKPDFPLDLELVDLRDPPDRWRDVTKTFEPVVPRPRTWPVGNLRDEATVPRLQRLLVAAGRTRALLDRSFADTNGVEICLVIKIFGTDCKPLGQKGTTAFVRFEDDAEVRVTNRSGGPRFVTAMAADGTLGLDWAGIDAEAPVRRLAPGESIVFPARMVIRSEAEDDPRFLILTSAAPIDVAAIDHLDPLGDWPDCTADGQKECVRPEPGLVLADDLAVRSVQVLIDPEPVVAMGNAMDATAMMATWAAQFYSVLPYTPAEIAADAKLPEDQSQFLKLRSYEERQHRCGATLIAPMIVMTAAHCVADGQYAGNGLAKVLVQRRVRMGSRKLGKEGTTYAIAGVAVHAGYAPGDPRNDVALLLLAADRGSVGRMPAPLATATRPLAAGVRANAFGWGLTGAVSPTGSIIMPVSGRLNRNAETLQYGELASVSLDACRRKLADKVTPGMVCMFPPTALAGRASGDGVFTCRGDSGGPLVRRVSGRDELVGVVSWSMGCGYKDYPSVFADVGYFARWIDAAKVALKPGAAIRVADPARPNAASR